MHTAGGCYSLVRRIPPHELVGIGAAFPSPSLSRRWVCRRGPSSTRAATSCTNTTRRPSTPGHAFCTGSPTACCGCCAFRRTASGTSTTRRPPAASTPPASSSLTLQRSRCAPVQHPNPPYPPHPCVHDENRSTQAVLGQRWGAKSVRQVDLV